ncbi:hypothetical protein CONPUDRAFT_160882 [Coniophora puteana RWD-64-598 SS2]|uniref:Uncharacterized protein n=1 Tax=Coniophora puteana (strain RWD-64-598) TaxID=741705 RepID=A0A5M3N3N6_CONPW|nr:uncharacterized protein CONPUDRAFT_160882 [Coniophora puteana RWD-64-598 SS2]EIW85973.1 hypothetical protein CONPUDRAFT_160882 [Coniophora puteana RWD-64-598 SS2]
MRFTRLPELLSSMAEELNDIARTKYTNIPSSNTPAPLVDHGDIRCIIRRLSGAMLELDDALGALLRFKSTLNDSFLHHTRLVSKINDIPTEVMGSIFSHAAKRITGDEARTPICSIEQNFTQVCKRWREIAVASPFLWNLIKLDFQEEKDEKITQPSLELLARSGSVPVHLTIFTRSSFGFLRQEYGEILDLFFKKCASVEIVQSQNHPFEKSHIQGLINSIPRLKILTLTKGGVTGDTLQTFQNLQHLSRLRLRLISLSMSDVEAFVSVRWGSLKSLIIDGTPAFLIKDTINEKFPSLEALFFHTDRIDVAISPSSLVKHTKLRKLGISVPYLEYSPLGRSTNTATYRLLDQLDLPLLNTLAISAASSQHLDRLAQYDRDLACPLENIEILIGSAGSARVTMVDESMVQSILPKAIITKGHPSRVLSDLYAEWLAEYTPY